MSEKWLAAALDYIPRWIEFQMRLHEQPGCAIALTHQGKPVLDLAFGHADLQRGTRLTPQHRFRVASHSKSFTAAGLLKLREQGRLHLDQKVGDFVPGLHPEIGTKVTLLQLLSHSAGLIRDGLDGGQWQDRRPFLNEAEVRADLAGGPTIAPNSRFKYSNHGYALLGLVIEAVTGEAYRDWILREIIEASGLEATLPDMPLPRGARLARGHTGKLLLGHRLVIPGENDTHALSAATGFVSTASDLARYYASLSPIARKSVLNAESRREMARRQWREPHSSVERWYGLGTISGTLGDWDWFGHTGGFQGYITRSLVVPAQALSLSVLTNASDGMSYPWTDGVLHILRTFQRRGAASRRTAAWSGRWWNLWGALDLLPVHDKVLVANPALFNPLMDASEIEPHTAARDGTLRGTISLASGFANHGEAVRLQRDAQGRASTVWFGSGKLMPQARVARELRTRYGAGAKDR